MKTDPRFADVPVIMQSAASARDQILQGIKAGVSYYLAKPYDDQTLLAIVRAALEDAASKRKLRAEVAQDRDFPLIGGRLDYIGGRVTPSLVYRRRGHVINVFLWPAGQMSAASKTMDGYHVLTWTAGGFDFAAVSDLNTADLQAFANAFVGALKQ